MKLFPHSLFVADLKPRWVWVSGTLVLVTLSAGYLAFGASAGGAIVGSALANPLSLFAQRSPGVRGAGILAQTKLAYTNRKLPAHHSGVRVPGERVLSGTRSRPRAAPAASEPSIGGPLSSGVPVLGLQESPRDALVSPVSFAPTPGIGGAGVTGLVGGGGTGGVPGGNGTPPETVTAVPEPSTWLMMIAGFFLAGVSLRSRRREKARASGSDFGGLLAGKRL
jgi:hypothetical protein